MLLRRRSRAEDMEAFQVSERCIQDRAPPVPEALREKKKNQGYACSSSSSSEDSRQAQLSQLSSSPDLVVSCAAPVSSASQTVSCPLSSSFSSDPVIVHQHCPDTSKRNGLSLPRLEALGFVVTRRSRTLSLDDFSRRSSCGISASAALPAAAAAMKTLNSKDDSCLPFISDCSIAQLKKDLIMAASAAIAPISASKRFLSLADRSQSFDLRPNDDNSRRFYDLVGSPGPKFLLRMASQKDHQDLSPTKEESDDDEAKSASRKCAAAVPFKWEEAPGKPKAEALASQKQQPDATTTLQLPPRLAIVSFNANRKISRARSVNRRRGTDDKAPSLGGASSPRSTLCGPDLSSDTTSDSSALECDQAVMVSDAESATPNWQPSVELQMSEEKRKSFAARILHPEWLRIRRRSRKNSRGGGSSSLSQEWTPAMAAYFQSLDADSSEDFCSKKDDHLTSGHQLLLLDHAHAEDEETLSKSKSCNLEPDLSSEGGGLKIAVAAASDQAADGIMYCGCASPSLAPFSPSSRLRSFRSNSGKQKKRMVKRIRRSSRLLHMFVIKAVKQAVHPRRSKNSSKLLFSSTE